MGYLSCRAESSIITCRSISSLNPTPTHKTQRKSKEKHKEDGGGDDADDGPSSIPGPRIHHFTYRELESATGHFSDTVLLGRGSHGAVYKAVLPGGRPVAVKRPSRRPLTPSRDEVENEIQILSSLRGPRLVNLIGFTPSPSAAAVSRRERLLVVEFMPNGTLYDLLHSNPRPPGWARRLQLALQTAKALLALHSVDPPVIHRDVKSANVLIDRRFNARLGDFGLALRDDSAALFSAARATPPAGTLGYLDPSYVTPENLSTKTDVFSFGILLLEIMSGRKAIDVAHSPPSVVEWAVPLLKKGKILALYDPRIAPPKHPAGRRQLASLAASCVRSCKEKRPSMQEVVEQLKVLSKTVPLRAWNGLSVGNPCSVVDTERTLLKLNPNSLNLDRNLSSVSRWAKDDEQDAEEEEMPAGVKKLPSMLKESRPSRNARRVFLDASTRGSRNLMELMARTNGEPVSGVLVGGSGSQRSIISRARTVHVAREFYDRGAMLRLRRNQSMRGVPLEAFSRLDGLEKLEEKVCGQAVDPI
ncbi:serine/threonine-protein kinase-like protein [Cocos nucifera]|uniref:Serine/threonine-protein kinase-like protein n=1 Tax=Cocos nucifera TaxID=13894 RepID=A0A8K0I158_COCNU|nr:serine/threonine-protein kinase-like protein [Cocos nucifera]